VTQDTTIRCILGHNSSEG